MGEIAGREQGDSDTQTNTHNWTLLIQYNNVLLYAYQSYLSALQVRIRVANLMHDEFSH
jgi:hypothetical protein